MVGLTVDLYKIVFTFGNIDAAGDCRLQRQRAGQNVIRGETEY